MQQQCRYVDTQCVCICAPRLRVTSFCFFCSLVKKNVVWGGGTGAGAGWGDSVYWKLHNLGSEMEWILNDEHKLFLFQQLFRCIDYEALLRPRLNGWVWLQFPPGPRICAAAVVAPCHNTIVGLLKHAEQCSPSSHKHQHRELSRSHPRFCGGKLQHKIISSCGVWLIFPSFYPFYKKKSSKC